MALTAGTKLGPYEIIGPIGAGGMGEVYKARDTRLNRTVAIKLSKDQFSERFEREAQAIAALNHPNICTLYDIGPNYLVMELVEGRPLGALTHEELTLAEVSRVGSQIARALAEAHAVGIVHRDIKPSNIMMRADGYVKVLDFGLAHQLPSGAGESETRTAITDPGTRVGTIRYMSPEQARGAAMSPASDIFSLGIVLYELAAGRHPFEAESQLAMLSVIVSTTPLRPSRIRPEIPAQAEDLILRMLEKDPRLRPSAEEVAEILAETPSRAMWGTAMPSQAPTQRFIVGRRKELGELAAAFESAERGSGLLACVAGEAGIGKSTLLEDFALDLRGRNACQLAAGRCSERLAGSEAYLPLLEALESLLRAAGERAAQIMKLTAPTWYVQVVPLSSRDSSEERVLADVKAASQERLKRELVAFLEEVSRPQPLVLFLDDMHWADASTVDLMAYVGMRIARMRVLMVAAYRPSDLLLAKHPFLRVRQELQAHGTCRELSLGFLSASDVETYLALQFPENSFPPELARTIHANTEGNALFMADLTRYLRDRGNLAEVEGRWRLVKPLAEIERDLPESVRSMIQRKIDQLDEAGRRLAVAAAVQGQEFDSAVVAKVLAIDSAECEERLEALDRLHGLVRLIGDREFPDASLTLRYSFVHVLYQNALESSLAATRKASLSAAFAQALMEFYGERRAEVAPELALLFHAARDFARASDHFLQAARNAARVYAFTETIALCERAIGDAEKLKDTARNSRVFTAALEIGAAYQALARFDDAVVAFSRAEDAAASDADREGQATAVAKGAVVLFYAKRVAQAREHAQRALDFARTAGSAVAIASSELVLGISALCLGNVSEAAELLSRAEPVLRFTQPLATQMQAFLFIQVGNYEQSARAFGEGYARARELGDCFVMLLTLFMRGRAQGNLGRISEALATLDEGCRVADQVGDRYFLPRLSNTRAWLLAEAQNPEAALGHNLEGAQVARGFGDVESECNCHINAAHDYTALGEHARALVHLREAERLSANDVWFRWIYYPRIQEEFAAHWIALGDLKQAVRHAASQLEDQNPKRRAWAHKLLGDIAALEEHIEDARGNYDAALQLMAQFPCPTIEWQILKAAANVTRASTKDELLSRARAVVHGLAESIRADALRNTLLHSPAVRALG